VDASLGGLQAYVPAATPVQPGQTVRLCVNGLGRPELASLGETPLDAIIVRVDRRKLLQTGHLAIGVKFAEAEKGTS
jgi:hypothetical protein